MTSLSSVLGRSPADPREVLAPAERHEQVARARTRTSLSIQPAMPIKIANIRLELGESEEGLPAKIASRLELPEGAILGAGGSSARASTPEATTTSISPIPRPSTWPAKTSRGSARRPRLTSRPTFQSDSHGRSRARAGCAIGQ